VPIGGKVYADFSGRRGGPPRRFLPQILLRLIRSQPERVQLLVFGPRKCQRRQFNNVLLTDIRRLERALNAWKQFYQLLAYPGPGANFPGFYTVAAPVMVAMPEPSTWVMMILGFVGLGFMGYRVRDKAALGAV
jgi:hypothetical protein